MPYYEKSEDWLHQSALLLQARPQTTRVTTSYSLRPAIRPSKAEKITAKEARRAKEAASSSASSSTKKSSSNSKPSTTSTTTTITTTTTAAAPETKDATVTATQKPPRGHLVLKTFDPHSGVCLKYKTSKAAEVGRLIQMLGQLGRRMAALPVDEAKEASAAQAQAQAQAQGRDVVMGEAGEEGAAGSGTATPAAGAGATTAAGGASTPAATGAGGGAGGGQGKKKKKGKR